MIAHYTDNGSDQPFVHLQAQTPVSTESPAGRSTSSGIFAARRASFTFTLSRTLLHSRATVRLARRRPSVALGIAIAAGSAFTAGGSVLAHHMLHRVELSSAVAPLAPAPAAPAVPTTPVEKHPHHILASLGTNPLRGLASWYGDVWNGRKTASGEVFDDTQLTAAHKTLPLGTIVRVTNLRSMRSVVVRINDRGTLTPDRIIDLSSAAAEQLGMVEQGLAHVKLEVLGRDRT